MSHALRSKLVPLLAGGSLALSSSLALAAQRAAEAEASAAEAPAASPAAKGADELTLVKAEQAIAPGLVLIEGGRTTIGSSEKEVEELLSDARYKGFDRVLDSQTPQHTADVATFYLGRHELTNKEYKLFVDATHHRPPIHWAPPKALEAASLEFAKAEAEKAEEARKRGETYTRRAWNSRAETSTPQDRWWAENWQEVGFEIPKGEEDFPVVYVAYEDAVAYCRWAGVRLPTEFEFQRAARKNGKAQFPWGEKWLPDKGANTIELRKAKPFAVGSFPAGNSPFGIADLSGNVWEWTSSPYIAYPRFKPNVYKLKIEGKNEVLEPLQRFDPNQRVIVGGSFQEAWIASRVTTRFGGERVQFTDALGFRIAASTRVGLDMAQHVYDGSIINAKARPDAKLMIPGVVAIDRWETGANGITGYDHILYIPVEKIEDGSDNEFRTRSRAEPVPLGVFSTSVDLLEPELPAGRYFVYYRAKGKAPRIVKQAAEQPAEGETPQEGDKDKKDKDKGKGKDDKAQEEELVHPLTVGLDLEKDQVLLVNLEGERVAAVEAVDLSAGTKGDPGGSFSVRQETERVGSGATAVIKPRIYLDLEVRLAGRTSRQVVPVKLALRPAADAMGAPWRQ